jgi:hypothetical protein
MLMTPEDRKFRKKFWSRVDVRDPAECWFWTGPLRNGYGYIRDISGRQRQAHAVTYEWALGPIPPGLEPDHLCRKRACVNPLHLEAVTRQENMRRSPIVGRHANRTWMTTRSRAWKLTVEEVREIRSRAADGETQGAIAERFGIHKTMVSMIVSRKRWPHVT